MISQLVSLIAKSGTWAYLLEAILIFAEDALFFGFVLPAEIVLVLCAFLAQQHALDLRLVASIACVAAILGDQVGFRIGKHFGDTIRESKLGTRIGARSWDAACELLSERHGVAVFLGRWTVLLRSLVPTSSGIIRMPWSTFTGWNVVGGISWALAWTAVGYVAGASWEQAATRFGEFVAAVSLTLLALVVFLWRRRRHSGS